MKALVFGVFDRFHKGHEYFLSKASERCEELVVVVTLPHIVELMKKKTPKDALNDRMEAIRKFNPAFLVVEGDAIMGEWKVFKDHKPDIVFLGYDQQGIATELDKLGIKYTFLDAHFPEKYKSSIL